jgi:hypothetical protein
VPWDDLPEDECDDVALDFLKRLLTYDPAERLGANGAEEVRQNENGVVVCCRLHCC